MQRVALAKRHGGPAQSTPVLAISLMSRCRVGPAYGGGAFYRESLGSAAMAAFRAAFAGDEWLTSESPAKSSH